MARCSNGHEAAPGTAGKKFCTVCGAPMMPDTPGPVTPPPPQAPEPDASRRSRLVIGAVTALVLLIGAGAYFGVTQLTGSNASHATPAAQLPTITAPPDTTTVTVPTAPATTSPAPPAALPPATTTVVQPPPPATPPSTVVEQYFADINAGDYNGAWAIGGKNLQGGTFDSFVQGFATTASDSVTIVSTNGDTVQMQLDALQTDGTHKYFAGTYTVQNGVIVAADVRQTG